MKRVLPLDSGLYLACCLAGFAPCPAIVVGFRTYPWLGLVAAIAICGTCVLGLVLFCLLLCRRKWKSGGPWFNTMDARFAAWLGLVMLAAASSVPISMFVQSRDVRSAKRWGEDTVAPAIDHHFANTGAFPARIEDILDFHQAPYLWRAGQVLYKHDERYFSMDVMTSLFAGEIWSSKYRRWDRYD